MILDILWEATWLVDNLGNRGIILCFWRIQSAAHQQSYDDAGLVDVVRFEEERGRTNTSDILSAPDSADSIVRGSDRRSAPKFMDFATLNRTTTKSRTLSRIALRTHQRPGITFF